MVKIVPYSYSFVLDRIKYNTFSKYTFSKAAALEIGQ